VTALAAEHDADLVVLDAAGLIGPQGYLADWVVAALSDVTADVVLLPNDPPTTGLPFAVPFGGTEHDWAAAELAALLAKGIRIGPAGDRCAHRARRRLPSGRPCRTRHPTCGRGHVEPILTEATVPGLLTALAGTTAVIGSIRTLGDPKD
jgi:hypothetical protein